MANSVCLRVEGGGGFAIDKKSTGSVEEVRREIIPSYNQFSQS